MVARRLKGFGGVNGFAAYAYAGSDVVALLGVIPLGASVLGQSALGASVLGGRALGVCALGWCLLGARILGASMLDAMRRSESAPGIRARRPEAKACADRIKWRPGIG